MTYSVVITIDNRLMADLTDPSPHLVHGVLDGDAWPTIKKSETSSEIRVNSLNCMEHQCGICNQGQERLTPR